MPIRFIGKRPVGETPTGATDGTTQELNRIARSEAVALPPDSEVVSQPDRHAIFLMELFLDRQIPLFRAHPIFEVH